MEARQWDGSRKTAEALSEWSGKLVAFYGEGFSVESNIDGDFIGQQARPSDWILKNGDGVAVCTDADFKARHSDEPITPEMLAAGARALNESYSSNEDRAAIVYRSMRRATYAK